MDDSMPNGYTTDELNDSAKYAMKMCPHKKKILQLNHMNKIIKNETKTNKE